MKRIQYHKAVDEIDTYHKAVNEIDTGDNISNQIKCNAQQKYKRKHLLSSALKILIRNSNLVYEKSNELFLKLQK
jgi:hypothetical protein